MWGSKFSFFLHLVVIKRLQHKDIQHVRWMFDIIYISREKKKSETKAILNQWRVLLKQQKILTFSPFLNTDVEFCCCLFGFAVFWNYWLDSLDQAVLDVHVWHWWSGHKRFLKAHDDFTYKIITPWMKLFIHFYTNRWICTIWETSKERKHCQDQEGGFSKYFLLYILIIDHFYIALLSALKKTHCAVVACDSEWVTVCSLNIIGRLSGSRATNIYFSSYILHNDL